MARAPLSRPTASENNTITVKVARIGEVSLPLYAGRDIANRLEPGPRSDVATRRIGHLVHLSHGDERWRRGSRRRPFGHSCITDGDGRCVAHGNGRPGVARVHARPAVTARPDQDVRQASGGRGGAGQKMLVRISGLVEGFG